ncbi:TetR/AcrR family transcriptional regulator [Nakamurella antarctica]|uniref:TetR/AcrR family transcriptional regulator n=1 Tax=Nakamurella antarctica TaxID=1902245 RepID=A0A3G8ZST9_9ACTN|nr:TetR/AcrR family transcriptional regulator [Nakamurella antarctica]AZI57126.1 TetR/AcrR family transcriptional regulator [Nakamurella antarctica]
MASDTRYRILHALRTVLARGGASSVTLEAVAAEAGVSKGGLLYHFPTKEALYEGVLLLEIEDITTAMSSVSPETGAARGYLEFSLPKNQFEADYITALIAAVRSDECLGTHASDLLTEVFNRWDAPLLESVADPVAAQTIRLVGLGLYLGAIAGLPIPDKDLMARVFDSLIEKIDA